MNEQDLPSPLEAVVSAVAWETPTVKVIELRPRCGGRFPAFECGSHIELQLPDGQWRRYSLVSSPADTGSYRVAVQAGASDVVRWLTETLAPGDAVMLRGPHGSFTLADDAAPVLFLAGGIGITPFLNMIETLQARCRPWHLVYAIRSRAQAAFLGQLDRYTGRVTLHVDEESGRVFDVNEVLDRAAQGTHVYACGPGPMMSELERQRETRRGLRFHRDRAYPAAA